MSDAKYRAIFIGLGAAFVLVVALGWIFGSPDGSTTPLPQAIEQISPTSGSQVPLQTPIEVDMPVGYRIEMYVDGFRVPESELRFVEGTGVFAFSPHQSEVIGWGSGPHSIRIVYFRVGGLPDTGEFSWTIRVF